MVSISGARNPSASLAPDLTPVRSASEGGVFFREQLDLAAGPHTLRLQVQLPQQAVEQTLQIQLAGPAGETLATCELSTAAPEAMHSADRLYLQFSLEQAGQVTVEGTASSHASTTHLRFLTQAPISSPQGQEARFRFFPDMDVAALTFNNVIFGTTAICNANCFHCPTNKAYTRAQAKGHMDGDLFERILIQLAELQFKGGVMFGLFGEPLQDPLLLDRLKLVRRHLPESHISVSTNAGVYDPAKHREAMALVNDLAVHIEGVSPAVYNASMKPLKTTRTFPRVEALIDDRADRYTHVVTPVHRRNLDEVALIRDQWETRRGIGGTHFTPLMNRAGQGKAFDDVCLDPQATACSPDILRDLIVDWDGAVLTCCQDFHRQGIIGDLSRQTLQEFVISQRRRQMAEALNEKSWNTIPICAGCKNDCQATVDGLIADRMSGGEKDRYFGVSEFRFDGPVDRGHAVARTRARRPLLTRLRSRGSVPPLAVVFGPYKSLQPGRYRIRFDLEFISAEPGGYVTLDVAMRNQSLSFRTLEPKHLRLAGQYIFDVDIAEYAPMEFRARLHGVNAAFKGVSTVRLDS